MDVPQSIEIELNLTTPPSTRRLKPKQEATASRISTVAQNKMSASRMESRLFPWLG